MYATLFTLFVHCSVNRAMTIITRTAIGHKQRVVSGLKSCVLRSAPTCSVFIYRYVRRNELKIEKICPSMGRERDIGKTAGKSSDDSS